MRKRLVLRWKIVMVNTVLVLIPVLFVGMLSFFVYCNYYEKNIEDMHTKNTAQVKQNIEILSDECSMLAQTIFYNPQIYNTIKKNHNLTSNVDDVEKIRYYLNNFLELCPKFLGLTLVCLDGASFSTSNINLMPEEIRYILEQKNKKFIMTVLDRKYSNDMCIGILPIYGKDSDNFGKIYGYGVVSIKSSIIENTIPRTSDDTTMFMLANNGSYVYIDNKRYSDTIIELISKNELDSIKKVEKTDMNFIASKSEKVNFIVGSLYAEKPGLNLEHSIIIIVLMISLLSVFASAIASSAVNMHITKPIKILSDGFKKVAQGNFKTYIEYPYNNEMKDAVDKFNLMVKEVRRLTKTMLSTQEKLYLFELENSYAKHHIFQEQINSHFLYNTLSAIRNLATKGDYQNLSNSITGLIIFLRYAGSTKEYATVMDEAKYLNAYFEILQLRHKKKLKYHIDISSEVQNAVIVKLIMQPIAENSIMHGLKEKGYVGFIRVKCYCENEFVVIKIFDNGVGMNKETLDKIDSSLRTGEFSSENIGLKNTYTRLKYCYSEKFSLKINSYENIGTVVTIKVPLKY